MMSYHGENKLYYNEMMMCYHHDELYYNEMMMFYHGENNILQWDNDVLSWW